MNEPERGSESAEQVTTALRQLQHQLLTLALTLVDGLEDAVPEAPLNQRISALKALMDGVLKLEARIPQTEPQEKVYRIEYQYPDGTIHDTPPWAGSDSAGDGAIHGGGLWASLRKDRTRQSSHS